MLYDFLKNLLGLGDKKNKDRQKSNPGQVYQTHDIVDYDGMGNQGRFPATNKKL